MVTLASDAEESAADALRTVPGVDVVIDAPVSAVLVDGHVTPVQPALVTVEDVNHWLEDETPDHPAPLFLVNGVLDERVAARLEDAGAAYVDAAHHVWLPRQPRGVRTRQLRGEERLGHASLRAAQLIADRAKQDWTTRSLAEAADITSVTAHRLLRRLESAGLLERRGVGRSTKRHMVDASALWDWLAEHGRPGRAQLLAGYARDPLAAARASSGPRLVLTGSAAAEHLGVPVLSSVSRPLFRVRVDAAELESIPSALGGFRTDRGANFVLVADPYDLAGAEAVRSDDGVWVAPPSRVMLDMYLEPRGDAAAAGFRDLWLSHGR